jgi:hypothetical protein
MPLALLALSAARPYIAFSYTIGETLMNLLLAATIHRVVMFPRSAIRPHPQCQSGRGSRRAELLAVPVAAAISQRQSTAVFAQFPSTSYWR